MLFYEEFIKKIDGKAEGKGIEKFGLDIKKTVVWLVTGILFLVAGVLEFYISWKKNYEKTDIVIGIIFLVLSFRHIKMYLSYRIALDFNERKLKSRGVNFDFDKVKTCVLREQVLGKKKRMEVILDIITEDGEQIIIPLMMNNKLRFVNLMKNQFGRKFTIEK